MLIHFFGLNYFESTFVESIGSLLMDTVDMKTSMKSVPKSSSKNIYEYSLINLNSSL